MAKLEQLLLYQRNKFNEGWETSLMRNKLMAKIGHFIHREPGYKGKLVSLEKTSFNTLRGKGASRKIYTEQIDSERAWNRKAYESMSRPLVALTLTCRWENHLTKP